MADYYSGRMRGDKVEFEEFDFVKETKCFVFLKRVGAGKLARETRVPKETMAEYSTVYAKTKEEVVARLFRWRKGHLNKTQARLDNIEAEIEMLKERATRERDRASESVADFWKANCEYLPTSEEPVEELV